MTKYDIQNAASYAVAFAVSVCSTALIFAATTAPSVTSATAFVA